MTDGPALLGKHCHEESSEHHSQLAKHPSSPQSITAHPSTPTTPVEPTCNTPSGVLGSPTWTREVTQGNSEGMRF